MKKKSRYSLLVAVGLIAAGGGVRAQSVFSWRAPVEPIAKDGFYQILLGPGTLAKCRRADLGDLRILGPEGRFVSYVLREPLAGTPDSGWLALPAGTLVQKDSSDKHSYLEVGWSEAFAIDRIRFTIRDPVFYKREAEVYAEGVHAGEWAYVCRYSLAPGTGSFAIPAVKTRRIRMVIANADNAPLVVREIAGFQAPRFLVSYLRAGGHYALLAGDAQAVAPEYDLKYFTDSLKSEPLTLIPGPMQRDAVADNAATAVAKPAAGERSGGLLLWGILLTLLILLTFLSVKMVKTITQKERHDRL